MFKVPLVHSRSHFRALRIPFEPQSIVRGRQSCRQGLILMRARGDLLRAAEMLERTLALSIEGGHVMFELYARVELVLVSVDIGDIKRALSHVDRGCQAAY